MNVIEDSIEHKGEKNWKNKKKRRNIKKKQTFEGFIICRVMSVGVWLGTSRFRTDNGGNAAH